ncbi:MAG: LysR family transcriptional regulator [Clostridiales bacterium]|nr:LysR family transcriptional regulator [Clostridiales bacterium]
MNVAEIETFLMIVKTKNITKTAENLFLSQPTVSHRLKNLEDELQIKLVTRKKGCKAVELTGKGEEFIPIAEHWLSLWREMQMLQHGQERRFLTLGSTDTVNMTILGDFYRRLREEGVNLDLNLRTHQSYEIYDLLEKHDIDVGFVYHRLKYKNVVAKPILKEKMYLMQPMEGAICKKSVHTDELDPERELYLSWDDNFQIWHEQWLGKISRPRLQIDSFGLIMNFLTSEPLWMIAPVSIVKAVRKQHPVYVSELANKVLPPERTTFEVRHKNPNVATQKAVEIFEEKLEEYMAGRDWSMED